MEKRIAKAAKVSLSHRLEMAEAGKFEQLPAEHMKMWQCFYWKKALTLTDLDVLRNVWIQGPGGSGNK